MKAIITTIAVITLCGTIQYLVKFYLDNQLVFTKEEQFIFLIWIIPILLMCFSIFYLMNIVIKQDKKIEHQNRMIEVLLKNDETIKDMIKKTDYNIQNSITDINHNLTEQIRDTNSIIINSKEIVRDDDEI